MAAAEKLPLVSVERYLAEELTRATKHEYLGGLVYAMAGAKNVHNTIATNLVASLVARLRGKRCQAFNSDTKVRLPLATHTRFYYPDGQVVCEPNDPDATYQDKPVVVIEVLSESTRRTDEGEKREAYLSLPTLAVYLLVETERRRVVAYRRSGAGFDAEVHEGPEAVVPLAEIEAELPLAEVYDRVGLECA